MGANDRNVRPDRFPKIRSSAMNGRILKAMVCAVVLLGAGRMASAQIAPSTDEELPVHKEIAKPKKTGTLKIGINYGKLEKGDHVQPEKSKYAGSYTDVWTLKVSRGVTYMIVCDCEDFSLVLQLADQKNRHLKTEIGDIVDINDDGFDYQTVMTFTAKSNATYRLYISSEAAHRVGKHKITLREL
jgi:hypothetical protein